MVPNDDTQNYPFCGVKLVGKTLITQLNKPTNKKIKIKSPKSCKVNEKALGTLGPTIPMSPLSLTISDNGNSFKHKL